MARVIVATTPELDWTMVEAEPGTSNQLKIHSNPEGKAEQKAECPSTSMATPQTIVSPAPMQTGLAQPSTPTADINSNAPSLVNSADSPTPPIGGLPTQLQMPFSLVDGLERLTKRLAEMDLENALNKVTSQHQAKLVAELAERDAAKGKCIKMLSTQMIKLKGDMWDTKQQNLDLQTEMDRVMGETNTLEGALAEVRNNLRAVEERLFGFEGDVRTTTTTDGNRAGEILHLTLLQVGQHIWLDRPLRILLLSLLELVASGTTPLQILNVSTRAITPSEPNEGEAAVKERTLRLSNEISAFSAAQLGIKVAFGLDVANLRPDPGNVRQLAVIAGLIDAAIIMSRLEEAPTRSPDQDGKATLSPFGWVPDTLITAYANLGDDAPLLLAMLLPDAHIPVAYKRDRLGPIRDDMMRLVRIEAARMRTRTMSRLPADMRAHLINTAHLFYIVRTSDSPFGPAMWSWAAKGLNPSTSTLLEYANVRHAHIVAKQNVAERDLLNAATPTPLLSFPVQ